MATKFSSMNKWEKTVSELKLNVVEWTDSKMAEMPQITVDESVVDAVLLQWKKLFRASDEFDRYNEMTAKSYITPLIAELVSSKDTYKSMKTIFELMV